MMQATPTARRDAIGRRALKVFPNEVIRDMAASTATE